MFSFAYAWILIVAPLPIILRWLLPVKKQHRGDALYLPFYADFQTMNSQSAGPSSSWWRLTGLSVIWLLLVLAASGPEWLGSPIKLPRDGRDIMLAVDLSGSMAIQDLQLHGKSASRLQVVKQVADQFIENRVGDRLGLILFGSRAYLQTPLTFDRKTVAQMLADATVGLAGTQTAIGDAMGLAIKRLVHYPKQSRILILLTDGGNNAGNVLPIDAAKVAAKEHIRIYTIGLGANRVVMNTFFGSQVVNPSADLDEKTLKQIATMTGGLYFRASSTQQLAAVYQSIDKLEPVSADQATFRPKTALYMWPLGLAVLLILFSMIAMIVRAKWPSFLQLQETIGRRVRT